MTNTDNDSIAYKDCIAMITGVCWFVLFCLKMQPLLICPKVNVTMLL